MHLTPAGGCWRHHCWLTCLLTSCLHTGIRAGRMPGDSDPNGPAAGIIPAICIIGLPLSNIQPAVNVFFPFCQSAVDYASHLHHSDCHCPGRNLLPAAASHHSKMLSCGQCLKTLLQGNQATTTKQIPSNPWQIPSIPLQMPSIPLQIHSIPWLIPSKCQNFRSQAA